MVVDRTQQGKATSAGRPAGAHSGPTPDHRSHRPRRRAHAPRHQQSPPRRFYPLLAPLLSSEATSLLAHPKRGRGARRHGLALHPTFATCAPPPRCAPAKPPPREGGGITSSPSAFICGQTGGRTGGDHGNAPPAGSRRVAAHRRLVPVLVIRHARY